MYMSDMDKSYPLLYRSQPVTRKNLVTGRRDDSASVVRGEAVVQNELVSGHDRVADLDHPPGSGRSTAHEVDHRGPGAERQSGAFRLGRQSSAYGLGELRQDVAVFLQPGIDAAP